MVKKGKVNSKEIVKQAILCIVETHPGITQTEIIEKMKGPRYKNMSGKTRNSIISRLKELVNGGSLQRHPPADDEWNQRDRPAPGTIHYYSPNYPMDDTIKNDIGKSITKLYETVEKIENEYQKYDFVILWDVYHILNGMGEYIQKSIERAKQQYELDRRSDRREISDHTRMIRKRIMEPDIKKIIGNKNCYHMIEIIKNVEKSLHKIDDSQVRHVVRFQKSRSAKQRAENQRRLDKVMDEYKHEYSKLHKIEMILNEKNLDGAERLVEKYLQDDPLRCIYEMCGKYNQMLRTELEDAVGKISCDRAHAIERQLQLHRNLNEEKDADMQDKIEDEIEVEKSKEATYDRMLDEICRLMKSNTRLKKILEHIKNVKIEGRI